MSGLLSFFEMIWQAIQSGIAILTNLISGIVQLIWMIPKALSFLLYSISQMPPVMTAFAVAFVSVSVVYLVIGR